MKKLVGSILFLLGILMLPTASPALTVNFYQATMGTLASSNRFAQLSGSGCVNLAGSRTSSSGTTVAIANSGGTARACIVNGSTTDEVRLFNSRITLSRATTIVLEIVTATGELSTVAAGTYSFAAALKNVASLSSSNLPKTANGILFKTIANGNDINQSGSASVTCGTTSAGTVSWSTSSICNKTEKESLTLSGGSNINHVSRYEFRTTANNDFFNFPASGHGLISKIKDVDGGSIEIEITLGTETAVQYPFAENFRATWESPVPGSRSSQQNTIPLKADLVQVTGLDSGLPLECLSVLSTAVEGDDKCSMAVPTSLQWRDIDLLKAKWNFTGGNCAKSWRFMVELAELIDPDDPSLGFKRFYFDNGKNFDATLPGGGGYRDCTAAPTFSDFNVADRQNKAPNWDLSQVGGNVNDTYSRSLSLVGRKDLRQIAIMLDPHPAGIDQSVDLFELVVNGNVFRPLTSVEFAETPTNELPLQGVEFRIAQVNSPSCQVALSQDSGQIAIIGGRYAAQLQAASLCGSGEYSVRFHLNGNPMPIEGLTSFFLN
jgi:hypothetical protein